MARKSEKFSIDEESYECTQLPARRGFEIYNKVIKVVMPAMRDMMKASPALEGGNEMAALMLIASAVEKMPLELALELAEVFAEHCTVKRGELWVKLSGEVFDQHFAGRYPHLTRWLFACMRINYQDFLGGLVGSSAAAAQ